MDDTGGAESTTTRNAESLSLSQLVPLPQPFPQQQQQQQQHAGSLHAGSHHAGSLSLSVPVPSRPMAWITSEERQRMEGGSPT